MVVIWGVHELIGALPRAWRGRIFSGASICFECIVPADAVHVTGVLAVPRPTNAVLVERVMARRTQNLQVVEPNIEFFFVPLVRYREEKVWETMARTCQGPPPGRNSPLSAPTAGGHNRVTGDGDGLKKPSYHVREACGYDPSCAEAVEEAKKKMTRRDNNKKKIRRRNVRCDVSICRTSFFGGLGECDPGPRRGGEHHPEKPGAPGGPTRRGISP